MVCKFLVISLDALSQKRNYSGPNNCVVTDEPLLRLSESPKWNSDTFIVPTRRPGEMSSEVGGSGLEGPHGKGTQAPKGPTKCMQK